LGLGISAAGEFDLWPTLRRCARHAAERFSKRYSHIPHPLFTRHP
jgi:hypothetical protein